MATTTKSGTRRAQKIHAVVTVAKFTDSSRPFVIVRPEASLAEFQPIHGGDYNALGYDTPLRDAAARFITHLESLRDPKKVVIGLLADESGSMHGNEPAVIQGINDFVKGMAEVKRVDPKTAGTVLAVIATDGLENASTEVSPSALTDLVAQKEEEGWTFIFLGAQIDAWGVGRGTLGLSGGLRGQTVSYRNTPHGHAAAFANITTDSKDYLSNQAVYASNLAGRTMKSVMEDGTVSTANINAPGQQGAAATSVTNVYVGSSPYANVDEALKTAKKKTS